VRASNRVAQAIKMRTPFSPSPKNLFFTRGLAQVWQALSSQYFGTHETAVV
jgi:hypothetical protein